MTITNTSTHDLLLPVILHPSGTREPIPRRAAERQGRGPDGSWLIDLSADLPADGVLEPGESSTGRTLTITTINGIPVAYDPYVSGVIAASVPPVFVTDPVTTATVGQAYQYQAIGFVPDADQLSYLVDSGPTGLTVDPASGLVTWTPASNGPAEAQVVLQVFDAEGARRPGVHHRRVRRDSTAGVHRLTGRSGRQGRNGTTTLTVQANDTTGSLLTYFASTFRRVRPFLTRRSRP